MAEKTRFNHAATLAAAASAQQLPAVCCGRCRHGVEAQIPDGLQRIIVCNWGPPTPTVQVAPNGQQMIRCLRPTLAPAEKCGRFEPAPDGQSGR